MRAIMMKLMVILKILIQKWSMAPSSPQTVALKTAMLPWPELQDMLTRGPSCHTTSMMPVQFCCVPAPTCLDARPQTSQPRQPCAHVHAISFSMLSEPALPCPTEQIVTEVPVLQCTNGALLAAC